MRYRLRTQKLEFNHNPVPNGTGFLRFLLRHLDSQNVAACSEYCLGFMLDLPTVLPNKQRFTLVNVCSPFYGESLGSCPPPPKEALPLFATWYFTFAIKNVRYTEETPVDYYSVKGVDCRTWTTGQEATVEFVTIGLTPERAKQFGLKNTLRHVQATYNLVGAYTKHVVEFGKQQTNMSFQSKMNTCLNLSATDAMVRLHPNYWHASFETWKHPGLLDPASFTDDVVAYCLYNMEVDGIDTYYHPALFDICRDSMSDLMAGNTDKQAFAALVTRYTLSNHDVPATERIAAVARSLAMLFKSNVIPDSLINPIFLNDRLDIQSVRAIAEVVDGNRN